MANNQPVMVLNQNGVLVPIFVPTTRTTVTGTTITPGGLNDTYNSLFTGKFPEFEAQLSLSLPIRNRVAQADNARALLAERQDQARLQQVINGVAVDVQTAQITLQEDRTAVVAAQKTRALQEQTLDAEQKKLQLGASTIFLVVTDQQALSAAAAAEVRAQVNLVEALVNFERAMGRTLEAHQISIANAKTGLSPRDTLIPGTAMPTVRLSAKINPCRCCRIQRSKAGDMKRMRLLVWAVYCYGLCFACSGCGRTSETAQNPAPENQAPAAQPGAKHYPLRRHSGQRRQGAAALGDRSQRYSRIYGCDDHAVSGG